MKTPEGRELVALFYKHSAEALSIIIKNPEIMTQCKANLKHIVPIIASALNHNKNISLRSLSLNENILLAIKAKASPTLKKDLLKIIWNVKKH